MALLGTLRWPAAWTHRAVQAQLLGCPPHPRVRAVRPATLHTASEGLQLGLRLRFIHPVEPVSRPLQRPGCEPHGCRVLALGSTPQTRPAPLLCTDYQTRAQGIALDVPAHHQKMIIRLHGEGLEAPLVQMAGSGRSMMGMPALRVGQRHPGHELREFPISPWPQHEMPVVRHDAVGENSHRRACVRLAKHALKRLEVSWLLKNRQTRVGPIEDVVDNVAGCSSQWSPHALEVYTNRSHRSKRFLTPFVCTGQNGS